MNILGISCYYHDAAAALLKDGKLIACAQEERFTRKKNDPDFPANAIDFVLNQASIKPAELDYVAFYDKPFLKFERIIKSIMQTYPRSSKLFREVTHTWFKDKLWIKSAIASHLSMDLEKILFVEHHMSHAASTFLCSPFEKAAILTVDGVGEWASTTIGTGDGTSIKLLKEIHFPHSLGLLYSAFTAFLGFEVNEGEYKVMGMAPFGAPHYTDKVKKVINLYPDGSFELNMDYFSFHYSTEHTYNNKFVQLFGEPRSPKSKFFTADSGYPSYFGEKPLNYEELCKENQYYADIAASIQAVLEEALIKLAKTAYEDTKLDKLCIAGGVGLNSSANYKILMNSPFTDLFIQPAAGDAGGAIGAALYVYNTMLGNKRSFIMNHAYFGKEYNTDEIRSAVEEFGATYTIINNEAKLLELTVDELLKGKVIGWFQGKFEWGPRALGCRSIIADARIPEMKDIVNTKIKFREPFRPFAPSVLAEHAHKYFDFDNSIEHYPAKFMLYVIPVKKEKQEEIPAVTHVDGTGRLQMVEKNLNPLYWNLINTFYQKTGTALILNTSFNLKGEPIVNTPTNALNTFSKSGMDLLIMGSTIVHKGTRD
ncbi:MAG: hypothetical protein A2Y62_01120 [Candidatus Fischerbacteria bacterium RBG_13_37_8]|uniref:Carbamoyltransferase n=1 Tax=Candidatus Fischerbacteria bacterium RBG_13_37_8 TaxID=1817863 RepID=A0A1F5VXS0_9BACT|nr:MAG: hypothetical protein A2Y62_01120 [Candidatus Fischerbacteria bacterium RBG_13_37_8]